MCCNVTCSAFDSHSRTVYLTALAYFCMLADESSSIAIQTGSAGNEDSRGNRLQDLLDRAGTGTGRFSHIVRTAAEPKLVLSEDVGGTEDKRAI